MDRKELITQLVIGNLRLRHWGTSCPSLVSYGHVMGKTTPTFSSNGQRQPKVASSGYCVTVREKTAPTLFRNRQKGNLT